MSSVLKRTHIYKWKKELLRTIKTTVLRKEKKNGLALRSTYCVQLPQKSKIISLIFSTIFFFCISPNHRKLRRSMCVETNSCTSSRLFLRFCRVLYEGEEPGFSPDEREKGDKIKRWATMAFSIRIVQEKVLKKRVSKNKV